MSTRLGAGLGRGLERLAAIAGPLALSPASDSFYFLRHGQTARNALRIFQSPDEPLDSTGEAQADAAAPFLAEQGLASMVCSDTVRTRQTAERVARHVGVQPVFTPALRERNFGALIGTSSANLDWDCAPEGGETLDEFVLRVHAALQDALAQRAPVLVVAHGGTLHVLAALLRVESSPTLLANARPLRFERRGSQWSPTLLGPLGEAASTGPNLA